MKTPKDVPAATTKPNPFGISRHRFLTTTAKGVGLTALFNGLRAGWMGSMFASDAPEMADLKFGMIALNTTRLVVGLNDITNGGIILTGREILGPGPDRGIVFQAPACCRG